MDRPLISIVLTTFNSKATIPLVLGAILTQTFPLRKLELIIVDGGSKDGTLDVIRKFLEENSHKFHTTHLIAHDKNYGVSRARNDGIKVSQGDYILVLDADVVLSYNAIELMVEKLNRGCCDVVLAFLFPSRQSIFDRVKLKIAKEVDCESFDIYYATNAALIPKWVIEKVGFFNEKMGPPFSLHEDIEYGARIKRAGFKTCKYRSIIAQHFQVEHDTGSLEVPQREVNFKMIAQYMISYLTTWYGRSFYKFISQLPKIEKIKWFSYSLIPVAALGLIVALTLNLLMVSALIFAIILTTFIITLIEYFNGNAKILSIIYACIEFVIRTIRVIGAIKYMVASVLTHRDDF